MDLDTETRTKEFVWVAKLSSNNKLVKWSGKEDGTLEQIVLKMAVLGAGAKPKERNIVEITTFDSEQGKVKANICSLSVDKESNLQLNDICLYPPVNFTLVEGSGPIDIVANHMVLVDEDDLSDEEDSDYVEDEDDMRLATGTKRKASEKGDAPKKSAKKSTEDDEDLDDDLDDDDSDFDDEEFDMPANMGSMIDEEALEDDKMSDEDEAEEVIQSQAPKKRKLTNGDAKTDKKKATTPSKGGKQPKAEVRTPKAEKQQKTAEKTPTGAKVTSPLKTPKGDKKALKIKYSSVDEVRTAIKNFPGGKPRKQDKFTNWLENQFKVDSDSWKNDLWKWHKKEQGL